MGLENFWNQVLPDDPRLIGHPMLQKPDWKQRAIPMILWGDGGAFTRRNNTLLALCCGFLLASGWSWKSIFYLSGVCKLNRSYAVVHGDGNDTMDTVWAYIKHGFNSLFEGVHPNVDPWNQPWPAGSYQAHIAGKHICDGNFFGVVWVLTHDLEYHANELKAPHFIKEDSLQY